MRTEFEEINDRSSSSASWCAELYHQTQEAKQRGSLIYHLSRTYEPKQTAPASPHIVPPPLSLVRSLSIYEFCGIDYKLIGADAMRDSPAKLTYHLAQSFRTISHLDGVDTVERRLVKVR